MFLSFEILIDAPASNVFLWLDEFDRNLQWSPILVSENIIEETPTKIGTKFRQRYSVNGKEFEMLGEITAYQQDKLIGIDCHTEQYSMITAYSLKSKGYDQTLLNCETLIQYKGFLKFFSPILNFIFKPMMIKQANESFTNLKTLCEAEYRAAS